ncbi:unnamed protein product [Brachionus calyciflorus]|uniref:EGF-like domain-containing protein n=1 Tax=Brachionus calyciflorus TaxID=104777 RepID=A0A814GXN0_9BILA|nr:unnamed protein product [Brachionus calyciflorus]
MLTFILMIFESIQKISSSKCIAIGSHDSNLRFMDENMVLIKPIPSQIIDSMAFDLKNNLLLAGTVSRSILIYDILNNSLTTLNTNNSINSLLSVNETLFLTGGDGKLVFYYIIKNSFHPVVKLVDFYISCLKLLKQDNLILIGSKDKKVLVYDLMTENFKVNVMNSIIKSIDFLNRNFIVSQCSTQWICVFKLELDNSLTQIIIGNFNLIIDIYSIKIIDDSSIIIGLGALNGDYLCLWNLKNGDLNYFQSDSRILTIEILDPNLIIYGQENGRLNLFNYRETKIKSFLNLKTILVLETIENCNTDIMKNYFSFENIAWSSFDEISFTRFGDFKTTRIGILHETIIPKLNGNTATQNPITKEKLPIDSLFNGISKANFYNYLFTLSNTLEEDNFVSPTDESFFTQDSFSSTTLQNVEKEISSILEQVNGNIVSINQQDHFSKRVGCEFPVQKYNSTIQEVQAIFNGQNIKALTNLMTSNIEMNDCLKNCSGNGKCKLVNNIKYGCECNENYAGSSCEINTLPCWSDPCKNNGSCINNLNNRTYTCECFRPIKEIILFYGQNCELKKDICENETCSNNGICYDIENKAEWSDDDEQNQHFNNQQKLHSTPDTTEVQNSSSPTTSSTTIVNDSIFSTQYTSSTTSQQATSISTLASSTKSKHSALIFNRELVKALTTLEIQKIRDQSVSTLNFTVL